MKQQLILLLLLFTIGITAQTKYTINGNKLDKVETTKSEPVKTSWSIDIKDVNYPVYKSTRGSYYIIRTSKKTGKKYKQYIEIEGV
ncbi:hypothetical protein N356_gp001 [Cellulophaga phage phi14:2]|uniref:Uncharacterized protein n=1 Tax=Cellulophaga phage phi14:2 TaxID=1327990 RepID=R9ZZW7_9CAUD|nr:hypothetical protein N356_gp001 [Cellulophaga phage phi14:2]AGO48879.1 hypothetical protein Phi14:2_gp001 [Cellulophaga phage phi14:2]